MSSARGSDVRSSFNVRKALKRRSFKRQPRNHVANSSETKSTEGTTLTQRRRSRSQSITGSHDQSNSLVSPTKHRSVHVFLPDKTQIDINCRDESTLFYVIKLVIDICPSLSLSLDDIAYDENDCIIDTEMTISELELKCFSFGLPFSEWGANTSLKINSSPRVASTLTIWIPDSFSRVIKSTKELGSVLKVLSLKRGQFIDGEEMPLPYDAITGEALDLTIPLTELDTNEICFGVDPNEILIISAFTANGRTGTTVKASSTLTSFFKSLCMKRGLHFNNNMQAQDINGNYLSMDISMRGVLSSLPSPGIKRYNQPEIFFGTDITRWLHFKSSNIIDAYLNHENITNDVNGVKILLPQSKFVSQRSSDKSLEEVLNRIISIRSYLNLNIDMPCRDIRGNLISKRYTLQQMVENNMEIVTFGVTDIIEWIMNNKNRKEYDPDTPRITSSEEREKIFTFDEKMDFIDNFEIKETVPVIQKRVPSLSFQSEADKIRKQMRREQRKLLTFEFLKTPRQFRWDEKLPDHELWGEFLSKEGNTYTIAGGASVPYQFLNFKKNENMNEKKRLEDFKMTTYTSRDDIQTNYSKWKLSILNSPLDA
eukprot:TRINITY_DN11576_c0_g1_i1.p1 TRINITY_DN11576_c0_g1~~TRINITY_DN11576_c0_g1_i1.p1  ORF type:complete len:606 (+),score=110.32 TRINITY_DN11576_c0_g1_i1:28-1818(+)